MISGKGSSLGDARVSADPQTGVLATGNRPAAWLTMRSPPCPRLCQPRRLSGIHHYAIAFQPEIFVAAILLRPGSKAGTTWIRHKGTDIRLRGWYHRANDDQTLPGPNPLRIAWSEGVDGFRREASSRVQVCRFHSRFRLYDQRRHRGRSHGTSPRVVERLQSPDR